MQFPGVRNMFRDNAWVSTFRSDWVAFCGLARNSRTDTCGHNWGTIRESKNDRGIFENASPSGAPAQSVFGMRYMSVILKHEQRSPDSAVVTDLETLSCVTGFDGLLSNSFATRKRPVDRFDV